ncbi:MAG: four helix bundle protein [Gemmatimonadota bacterium]
MRSHKDLIAWQRARVQTLAVFELAGARWSPSLAAPWDQLRRAALSVQLNLAEGHAMGPGRRCAYHVRIAYGSAVEVTELLELLDCLGLPTRELVAESRRVQALTHALHRSLTER